MLDIIDDRIIADFPCCLALVDDDETFLYSLKRKLGAQHATVAFSSTTLAFQYIHRMQEIADQTFGVFESYNHQLENIETGDDLILVDASRLEQASRSADRYQIISVAIVDQIMPRILGTEFCQQIRDTGIKTILLTGKMTDPETIAAFNDGLIDGYVSKSDPQAMSKIQAMVKTLHHQYVSDKFRHVTSAFEVSHRQILGHFAVKTILQLAKDRFDYSEYFYVPSAPGFLLSKADGTQTFCLIGPEAEQRELADVLAEDFGDIAPIQDLRDGKLICWNLFDQTEEEVLDSVETLKNRLFPCQHHKSYRWSLIPLDETPYRHDAAGPNWLEFKAAMNQLMVNDPQLNS